MKKTRKKRPTKLKSESQKKPPEKSINALYMKVCYRGIVVSSSRFSYQQDFKAPLNSRFIQGKKNIFSITDLADTSVKLGMHAVGVCQGVYKGKKLRP